MRCSRPYDALDRCGQEEWTNQVTNDLQTLQDEMLWASG